MEDQKSLDSSEKPHDKWIIVTYKWNGNDHSEHYSASTHSVIFEEDWIKIVKVEPPRSIPIQDNRIWGYNEQEIVAAYFRPIKVRIE